jgi:protease-4
VRPKYPFLYLVLASGLLAAVLVALNAGSGRRGLNPSVLADDHVAVVDIAGVLTSSHAVSRGTSSARSIIEELEKHGDDSSVRALVLRIDSPGGTVVAAQEVYAAVTRLREEKKKPVIASIADVGASGGYYIACAADRIYANPGTITGSIGVIMEFPNVKELFGKIGISSTTIKSGEFKDTGNALRDMTSRERQVLQELIDDVYRQFLSAVEAGRQLPPEVVRDAADGRIFTGQQAHGLGLVDELGDLTDAVEGAAEMAGIKGKPTIIRHRKKRRFWEIIEGSTTSLLPFREPPSARLLYLWK